MGLKLAGSPRGSISGSSDPESLARGRLSAYLRTPAESEQKGEASDVVMSAERQLRRLAVKCVCLEDSSVEHLVEIVHMSEFF